MRRSSFWSRIARRFLRVRSELSHPKSWDRVVWFALWPMAVAESGAMHKLRREISLLSFLFFSHQESQSRAFFLVSSLS